MFWYFGKSKKNSKGLALSLSKGFTLLELIVVIAIFLIITAVVMTDIPNFRDKSALDLTASEVATYIRGAQVYGASQKGGDAETGQASVFGIHLQKGNNAFYLFKNTRWPAIEEYEIKGFQINSLKIFNNTSDPGSPVDQVDIVYKANDYASSIGTQLESKIYSLYVPEAIPENFYFLQIEVASVRNLANTRCIRVYNNGQIAPAPCSETL